MSESIGELGGIAVMPSVSRVERFIALLWGKPGCGKTVLAATAPGKKLWLQFDPAGTASLTRSDDILVADFSSFKPEKMQQFKQGGMIERELVKLIAAHSIDTIVVDSLTGFGQLALYYGIASGTANVGAFRATIEAPGMTGYGVRTAMTLDFAQMVFRAASDAGCHLIFICHEQDKVDAKSQQVTDITLSLGGGAANVLPGKISEIWNVEDTGKQRNIYFRRFGIRNPMRTRMFMSEGPDVVFKWTYNQEDGKGEGIKDWYRRWQEAGFNKIKPPPK